MFRLPSAPARFGRVPGFMLLLLICAGLPESAFSQTNLRNTFPGRRVGGGTRGICTARVLAHLVPASSVYGPGSSTTIGVLEGPTPTPMPLVVEFRPLRSGGTADGAQAARVRRLVPAAPVGVTLLTVPALKESTIWESSYECDPAAQSASSDPLAFVSSVAPPAVSLLVPESTAADKAVQLGLQNLRRSCGTQVPRAEVARVFGLDDVVSQEWPAQVPVRCL